MSLSRHILLRVWNVVIQETLLQQTFSISFSLVGILHICTNLEKCHQDWEEVEEVHFFHEEDF